MPKNAYLRFVCAHLAFLLVILVPHLHLGGRPRAVAAATLVHLLADGGPDQLEIKEKNFVSSLTNFKKDITKLNGLHTFHRIRNFNHTRKKINLKKSNKRFKNEKMFN